MFASVKERYGEFSIERVESMLKANGIDRHPLQQGASMILPGIPQTPWHEPYEHPDIAAVVQAFEAGYPAIKAEYEKAWQADQFSTFENFLMTKPEWQALHLYRQGSLVEEASDTAPTAFGILKNEVVAKGKLCTLLESHFSTLLPGTSIPPHNDLWNFSIVLHFAVDIPENCGIRVAEETRQWREGKCLLFDYSFEHEAWNRGDRPRTCLLMDLWHPDTTPPEREALVGLVTEVRKLTERGKKK
ncbi:aspartyl/asparaginyl beta-hydroxylase domain-containing protein [Amycolatopsis sp. NBC_00345]|uniref:aspartyl/asparaginyl beta-hydroxylase domain-containing protein n=1 Tax=Amycolatopsis sp. NBC_00345 TaxID=2975955 RepID=UPI002E26238F